MAFFKALFVWVFMALVAAAAIVASVKGGILGVVFLAVVILAYVVMFAKFGCQTH